MINDSSQWGPAICADDPSSVNVLAQQTLPDYRRDFLGVTGDVR